MAIGAIVPIEVRSFLFRTGEGIIWHKVPCGERLALVVLNEKYNSVLYKENRVTNLFLFLVLLNEESPKKVPLGIFSSFFAQIQHDRYCYWFILLRRLSKVVWSYHYFVTLVTISVALYFTHSSSVFLFFCAKTSDHWRCHCCVVSLLLFQLLIIFEEHIFSFLYCVVSRITYNVSLLYCILVAHSFSKYTLFARKLR